MGAAAFVVAGVGVAVPDRVGVCDWCDQQGGGCGGGGESSYGVEVAASVCGGPAGGVGGCSPPGSETHHC